MIRSAWALFLSLVLFSATPASLFGSGTGERFLPSRLPLMLDRPVGLPRSLFPFHSYGAESGLGNLAARRIVQDKIGFLWVGTEDGLYRYDGDRFTRFDSSNGLPSAWITDLLATPEGNLWICTPQGLAAGSSGRFEPILSGGLPAGPCNAIARDSGGTIWVAHKDGLFYQLNNRFFRIPDFPAPATALVSLPEPSNAVFAAGKGVVACLSDFRIQSKYSLPPAFTEPVDSLAADNSGKVWAQCARQLLCLLPGSAKFRNESIGIPAVSSRGVLSTDRGGRLWVPTDEGMSCRIVDKWRHFSPKDGLPTDWTRFVFEDREGSLWVASVGIHRLAGRGSWTSWTRTQGLPSDTIWDIYRSRRGDLWVATDKGLCLATPDGWRVLQSTEKTVVRRIHEDSKGRLWLGLMPAGILRYDPAKNQSSMYESSSGVAGLRVLSIEEDGAGGLWAATDGAGLLRYRAEKNDFVREEVPGGTPEETFRYILRDRENRLWVTGEYGLLLRSGGKWRRFGRKNGLLQDHVSYLAEMRSGEFWLSYFEPLGIIRFRLEGQKLNILEQMGREKGLSSEKVYLLGEDGKNSLWVGTGKGIDIVSAEGNRHFSKGDGVAGDDIDAMAFLVEPNGAVFVGTSSGLSMYRDDADAEQMPAPKPVFLSASLGERLMVPGAVPIPKLPSRNSTLKVEFAVLSFLHQSQIEYGVRLKGLETEWHNSRFRETRYPFLSPGSYVYEVRSRLGSGTWSEPASLAFEIQQPWWRTWPAVAAALILIVSAAFGGFRWWLERLHKRNRHLEDLVSARTLELAIANADLERLSITDPLTGLKNRRFLEFSIVEDMARVRRTLKSLATDGQATNDGGANIAFLVVDIDYFKQVNDQFGHPAGDEALRKMGAVLGSAIRESDTIVRWGGEEFLIVARNPNGCDPAAFAERVRKQVESASFGMTDSQEIRLTCSIGFASWPFFRQDPDALGWEDILGLADRCLYLAKSGGRNSWIGLAARADYSGRTEHALLNDFKFAENAGIIEIKSSTPAVFAESSHQCVEALRIDDIPLSL